VALTTNDLQWIRRWTGDAPDDADLNARYDRLQSLKAVATEVVEQRLANFLANPASFSVDDYSQNSGENIRGMQKLLDALEDITEGDVDGGGGLRVIPPAPRPCR
jgi:hypothetical protein